MCAKCKAVNATRPAWRSDNAMAVHNHWHLALMFLAQGDRAAALALYDEAVAPTAEALTMNLELLHRDVQDLKTVVQQDGENIRGLARIAEIHASD